MVYRKGGRGPYQLRVVDCTGHRRICSCETPLKTVANAMEAWTMALRARHDPHRILEAITAKAIPLAEAYRLGEEGARVVLEQRRAAAADIDLVPLFAEFLAWRQQREKGRDLAAKYVTQLKVLFPGALPRSTFTPPVIAARLDALPVKDATRNRYRAAVSAFAKYLVRTGVLPHNPVQQVEGYAESRAQEVWYTEAMAKRILLALPPTFRAREALMVGVGMDWTDCARLRREDIDLKARTVRCHGSKTPWRNREVRITEKWVIPILEPLLAGLLPTAFVCPAVTPKAALTAHRAALKACGATDSTLHNWRHHYAVTALRRGEKVTVIAHQLGKTNIKDVLERYAKYTPQATDYVAEEADSATNLATTKVGGL